MKQTIFAFLLLTGLSLLAACEPPTPSPAVKMTMAVEIFAAETAKAKSAHATETENVAHIYTIVANNITETALAQNTIASGTSPRKTADAAIQTYVAQTVTALPTPTAQSGHGTPTYSRTFPSTNTVVATEIILNTPERGNGNDTPGPVETLRPATAFPAPSPKPVVPPTDIPPTDTPPTEPPDKPHKPPTNTPKRK